MDIASDRLFNILQVQPAEDLEDIHDGNVGIVCKYLFRLYYRSPEYDATKVAADICYEFVAGQVEPGCHWLLYKMANTRSWN